MNVDERLQALHILTKLFNEKIPLAVLMQQKELSPLSKEICFGVSRHYYQLQAIAETLLKKRPKGTEIWLCILMGLYQLHYLNLPDYAVVKETVALLQKIKKPWAKGFVNAVLRAYCRQHAAIQERVKKGALTDNHPDWFVKRIREAWPMQWQTILSENDTHPPMILRVNKQQTTREAYRNQLLTHGILSEIGEHSPDCLQLATPCSVHELPGFSTGMVAVQDEAAQLAASLLQLKPKLRVLDACCAPGGKTCHILEKEPNLTACIALDIEEKRLRRVQDNFDRLKLHATLLQGDALQPETWWDGHYFDRILLDAPCSATGVIRRHPDIKLLRTEAALQSIIDIQKRLLEALWPLLAPGGLLIYATCSVLPDENDLQIETFLKETPHADSHAIEAEWGYQTAYGRQILPGQDKMDGFFYAILKKQFPS